MRPMERPSAAVNAEALTLEEKAGEHEVLADKLRRQAAELRARPAKDADEQHDRDLDRAAGLDRPLLRPTAADFEEAWRDRHHVSPLSRNRRTPYGARR